MKAILALLAVVGPPIAILVWRGAARDPLHGVRFEPSVCEFGAILPGEIKTAEVKIINDGSDAVRIGQIAGSCGCLVGHGGDIGVPGKSFRTLNIELHASGISFPKSVGGRDEIKSEFLVAIEFSDKRRYLRVPTLAIAKPCIRVEPISIRMPQAVAKEGDWPVIIVHRMNLPIAEFRAIQLAADATMKLDCKEHTDDCLRVQLIGVPGPAYFGTSDPSTVRVKYKSQDAFLEEVVQVRKELPVTVCSPAAFDLKYSRDDTVEKSPETECQLSTINGESVSIRSVQWFNRDDHDSIKFRLGRGERSDTFTGHITESLQSKSVFGTLLVEYELSPSGRRGYHPLPVSVTCED